jgi:hypothetical protein
VLNIASVAHQAAGLDNFTRLRGHGERMARRQGGKLYSAAGPQRIAAQKEGVGPFTRYG